MIAGALTAAGVGAGAALLLGAATAAGGRLAARVAYHARRRQHGARLPVLAAPAGCYGPAPWYPQTLPEMPTAAELALDARFSNRMARYTPRPVPPGSAAWAALTALRLAAVYPAVTLHIAAAWADDREAFTRWPELAPAWAESTSWTMPALPA